MGIRQERRSARIQQQQKSAAAAHATVVAAAAAEVATATATPTPTANAEVATAATAVEAVTVTAVERTTAAAMGATAAPLVERTCGAAANDLPVALPVAVAMPVATPLPAASDATAASSAAVAAPKLTAPSRVRALFHRLDADRDERITLGELRRGRHRRRLSHLDLHTGTSSLSLAQLSGEFRRLMWDLAGFEHEFCPPLPPAVAEALGTLFDEHAIGDWCFAERCVVSGGSMTPAPYRTLP